jgi:rfaE bifunctional protein nucleotidyltransferase chain/domain
MNNKIKNLDKLKLEINKIRQKQKIVLCHGVFDLLHVGHIKHFKEAKQNGDILVVSLTPDIYVNKGPQRPAFSEDLRLEAIAALELVDYVCLNTTSTALNVINKIKPDIYCKGPDYKQFQNDLSGEIKNETRAIKKIRGKIVFTKDVSFSSGKLINQYSNIFTQKQKNYLNKIKKNYSFHKIKTLIENFKANKVLVIGETIIDQYVFCDALGK